MDAIKNYLESMFLNLPNTPEVQRAKYELGQMMEDKYSELRQEGKSENEAVGIVIAEFGNLDELADELGIGSYMGKQPNYNSRSVSFEEAKKAIVDNNKFAARIALGVLLCIICPVFPMWLSSVSEINSGGSNMMEAMGVLLMFGCIAVAVGLFVFSTMQMSKWNFLKHEPCNIDFATAEYVHNERENYRTIYALLTTVGIVLCVVCFVPAAVLDSLNIGNAFIDIIGGSLLMLIIGIGVYMLVAANIKRSGYSRLLSLNGAGTMGGNFVPSQKENVFYENKTLRAIMSVYWPTITCVYLCWSFLSFDWHMTWIIWPVAAIIHSLIKNLYGNR